MIVVCPDCGTLNPKQMPFCSNCGANLAGAESVMASAESTAAGAIRCPKCAAFGEPEQLHCEECGSPLTASKVTATSAPHQPAALPVKCHVCAAENTAHERFCLECGAFLDRGSENVDLPLQTDPASLGSTAAPAFDGAPILSPIERSPSAVPLVSVLPAAPAPVPPSLPGDQAVPAPVEEPVAESIREPSYCAPRTRAIEEGTPVWLIILDTDVRFDLRGLATVLIGRIDPAKDILPEVDLTLHGGELGGVSRRHAIITLRGEQWFLEDLDSMNGTWLNNRRLTPGAAQPLSYGDRLRVGRVVMLFETA